MFKRKITLLFEDYVLPIISVRTSPETLDMYLAKFSSSKMAKETDIDLSY